MVQAMILGEPEWIRLGEALRRYDVAIGYLEPQSLGKLDGASTLHNAIRAEMCERLTKSGASGQLRFKGASKVASALTDIPTEHFRLDRTFTFENEILPYAAEQTTEEWADSRNFENRHPTWIDVVAHRASFDNWLKTVRSAILQPASFDLSRLPDKKSLTLAETISFLAFGHALERGKISEWCDPSFLEREGLLQACLDEAQDNPELAHWPKKMPYDLERLLCQTLFEEKTPKPWPPSATRLHELAIEQNLRNHKQNLRFAVAEAIFHNGALEGKLQVTGIRKGEREHGIIDHRGFAHGYHLDWLADKIERGIFDGKDRDTWTEVFVERESLAAVLDPHEAIAEESAGFIAAFAKQARWGLLPSLVWIATCDMALTAKAARPGETFHGADIGLSIRKAMRTNEGAPPDWPCANLKDAWTSELAVRMSEGKLNAFSTRVSCQWDGGLSHNTPGIVFPPADTPGAALGHFIDDGNAGPFLRPNGSQGANSWVEFHDLSFARADIMGLWPEAKLVDIERGGDRGKSSIGGLTNSAAAEVLNVSEKSVERARVVRDFGVPELQEKVAERPGINAVKLAAAALWPSGIPSTLRRGQRNREIIAWCKAQSPPIVPPPSERTIRRAFEG